MYNKNHEKFFFLHDIMVSDDLFKNYFACSLAQCRGECCVQGDYGAPLELKEAQELEAKKLLLAEAVVGPQFQEVYAEVGPTNYYPRLHQMGTTLREEEYGGRGECVFVRNSFGISYCGLQEEHEKNQEIPPKPVSCHLYPVRMRKNPENQITYLEYDRWEICTAGCERGEKEGIPLFVFVQNGLKRAFGEEFYAGLERIYEDHYQVPA